MARPIRIAILANASQATKEIGGFGSLLKRAAGFAAGGAAIAALTSKFKEAGAAVKEQRQLMAQTDAVLKSTGNAAGVTARGVKSLADELERKSTLDAEAIHSGENLLLTFTNIANKAGKGNDIFSQTTRIMTDMSVALGQDTKSSALQLGKALNDPIKGVSALQRVGVTFTESQKKQIEALQKSGDRMGAQKIILAELNKEFGGSAAAAAAAAGPGRRLKIMFDDLFESIVRKALPQLERFALFLERNVPVAVAAVQPHFQRLVAAAKQLGDFLLANVLPALLSLTKFVARNKDFFGPFVGTILAVVAALKIWTVVQTALNLVMALNPLGLVVIAIAVLIGLIVLAYRRSETFRRVVDGAFNAVKVGVLAVIAFFGALPGRISRAVGDLGKLLVSKGRALLVGLARGYSSFTGAVAGFFQRLPGNIGRWIGNTARTLYSKGRAFLIGLVSGVTSFLGTLAARIGAIRSSVVRWLGDTARTLYARGRGLIIGIVSGVVSYLGTLASKISSIRSSAGRWIGDLGGILRGAGQRLIQGLINGISDKIGEVKAKMSELTGWIKNHLPGSPVKTGPLRSWNNGGAGKRLVDTIITGLRARRAALRRELAALSRIIDQGVALDAAAAVPALAAAEQSGAFVGTAPQITINVYALQDGPEIGRRVVRSIEAFERDVDGGRWRKL